MRDNAVAIKECSDDSARNTNFPLPPQRGQLKSFTDPNGNAINVTSHNTNGQIAEVERSATTNGVTTTESFLYTYIGGGNNTGLVQNLTLRRKVGTGNWSTIRQAVFTYYDVNQANGNQGDLETEQIEDASNNVVDTSYFRYYQPGEANGFTDGLKYYVSPESYARLAAAVGNPLTATDSQVAPYADDYYRYDSQQRVTLETTQGAGATGPGTYTYTYTNSTNGSGFNSWQTKTVETLPDGNQNTVYTNYAGEVMLTDFSDITDPANTALQGKHWITLDRYNSQGRLIEEAEPSAVTGYSDTTGRMRLLLPYDDLQPFNEFGLAIANRDELEWDIDIIDREGRPRLAGLETAVFWEGDFPHFEVSKDGKDHLFDMNLNIIF